MMAGSRSLSATTQSAIARRRLAVVAGSLVAVSATASAFLVDTTAGSARQRQHGPQHQNGPECSLSKLRSHESDAFVASSAALRSLSESWNRATTRVWSKLKAEDDIDARVLSAEEILKTSERLCETLRTRFQEGDSYVWLYVDSEGNPSSWEKYTVTNIEETSPSSDEGKRPEFVATIEMSTKFEKNDDYQTHHRIKANLIDHLLESSDSKDSWRIGFEFFLGSENDEDDGSWKPFGKGDNVQAFEEKFDVFSMISDATKGGPGNATEDPRDECIVPWMAKTRCEAASDENTRPVSLGVGTAKGNLQQQATRLTQTKRHGYTESWYGPSTHDTLSGIALYKEFPHSQHSFSLIERTTKKNTAEEWVVTDAVEVVV